MNMFLTQKYRDDEPGAEGPGDGKPTVEQLQAQIAALSQEKEAILANHNELLGETKKAKEAKRAAEAEAAEKLRKQAEADNNYEQLHKSALAELEKRDSELNKLKSTIATKEVKAVSRSISGKLADGENAELLAEFVEKRLKFTDDGVKVTDVDGNLTIASIDDLANEVKGSARFASLLRGNQSAGGGANGGSKNAGGAPTIKRSEFVALSPVKQMELMKKGVKQIND